MEAFVRNDYGEACLNYYYRTGDRDYLLDAKRSYRRAQELNPNYSIPHFNLALLAREEEHDYDRARRYLERVRDLEPHWPDGRLAWIWLRALESYAWVVELEHVRGEIKDLKRGAPPKDVLTQAVRPLGRVTDVLSPLAAGASTTLDRAPAVVRALRRGENPTGHVIEWKGPSTGFVEPESGRPDGAGEAGQRREARLKSLRQQADDLEGVLREAAAEAEELLKPLVPHEWLWTEYGLDWEALKRRDLARDLVWERDFDDLHVTSLITWGTSQVFRAVGESERRWLGRRRSEDADRLDVLFRTLRRHFWRDHELLLLASQAVTRDDRFKDRIQQSLVRGLATDPARRDRLMSLEQDEVTPEARRRAFCRALGEQALAPAALGWLGEQLEKTGDYAASLDAFERAQEVAQRAGRLRADGERWELGKARTAWALGRYGEALAALTGVEARAIAAAGWREATLKAICDRTGASRDDGLEARLLVGWLEDAGRSARARGDAATAADVAKALMVLMEARFEDAAPRRAVPVHVDDWTEAVAAYPAVALEVDRSFFGEAGETDTVKAVISGYLPVARETSAKAGFKIPDVRIRANDWLETGRFVVRLRGLPAVSRRIQEGNGDGLVRAMVDELENVVTSDPASFLTLDRLQARLDEWGASSAERRRLIERAVASDAVRVRLFEALRELVAGGDSLGDLGPILRVISDEQTAGRTPAELAEEFRAALVESRLAWDGFELAPASVEDGT